MVGGYRDKDIALKTKARLSLACFDHVYISCQGRFVLDLFSFLVAFPLDSFVREFGSFSSVFRHSFFVVSLV